MKSKFTLGKIRLRQFISDQVITLGSDDLAKFRKNDKQRQLFIE